MSFLSKIKNIKSFADFKQKVSHKVGVCRRNASFVIHDWLVSLIHGEHRNNVFDFNVSHIEAEFIGSHLDVDQLLKVLDSSKQQKVSPNHQVKGKRGNEKPFIWWAYNGRKIIFPSAIILSLIYYYTDLI